jgi:hypothetical protein
MYFQTMKLRIKWQYCMALMLCAILNISAQERKCGGEMLLDGSEPLISIGLDTTGHWWAVTSPFSKRYAMRIDGKRGIDVDSLRAPVFSTDGQRYAYPIQKNGIWSIITESVEIPLGAGAPGFIGFSRYGTLAYSVIDAQSETIYIMRDDGVFKQVLINRVGDIALSFDGSQWAYRSRRAGGISLMLNDAELGRYDECIIAGFMVDNTFIYAGKQGDLWRVNKNDEELLSAQYLKFLQVNQSGNTLGCAYGNGTRMTGYLNSNEYIKPLETTSYDRIDQLILHPFEPMMGLTAFRAGMNFLVMNTAEYDAGINVGTMRFSHDGQDIYLAADSQQDPFMIVNGQKFTQKNALDINRGYAMAPKSGTFAYATSSAMVMQRMNDSYTNAGMMADFVSAPIFNHRVNAYQSLGVVNNRLFLMYCKP